MAENDSDYVAATHNPIAIANYFIKINREKTGKGLTLMQILKLSYIAHGFKLASTQYPLANEAVQAWKYGPVFSSVYDEFKHNGPKEITNYGMCIDDALETFVTASSNFSDIEKRIMDLVYDIYGELDGWRLSELTHEKGTPWYTIREKDKQQRIYGTTIPNEVIRDYFRTGILDA